MSFFITESVKRVCKVRIAVLEVSNNKRDDAIMVSHQYNSIVGLELTSEKNLADFIMCFS